MLVKALNHVNIECKDIDQTAVFYQDVLGLISGKRPNFPRPGYWLYANDQPIIHLMPPAPDNAMLTGSHDAAISHFAMQINDYDKTKAHLDHCNIAYEEMSVPGTDMQQLFFDDPNGVLVELIHIPK